tara:strand:- start:63 stop:2159 length:2097 start_codon:yes stop_codon:yes gene_type:complete
MPRKRGLISGASFGARLGGIVKYDDVIDFLRSFGNGLRNFTTAVSIYSHGVDMDHIAFNPDGTRLYILEADGDLMQYTLSTPYDISTKTLEGQRNLDELSDSNPTGFAFSGDGNYLYVLGITWDAIAMFKLGNPYDIQGLGITRGYGTSIYRNIQSDASESYIRGFTMKPDGTRIFACGYGNDKVYQWNLSTAFDLTTCSYIGSGSLDYVGNPVPRGVDFKPDGTKMYLIDSTQDRLYEVSLSNAWDVTSGTLSNTGNFDISSQEANPTCVRFRPDGRSFYMLGENGNDLNEYRLTTAWDLSTASYFTNLSLSGWTDHYGFSWNTDGTQLVVGTGDSADLQIMNCPAASAGTYSFNVTASGSTDYTVSGTDREGSVSGGDPNVYVHVGDTIEFAVSASSHPFYIRESAGGSNVSGVTNQGATNATVSWTPSTAGAYVYQCGSHSGMVGNIFVEPKGYDLSQMTTTGRTTISMDDDYLNNSGVSATGENYDFYHVAIADCLIVDSGSKILLLDPWNSSYDKFSSFSLRVADDVTTLIDGTRGTEDDLAQASAPIDVKWSPQGDKCFVLDDNDDRILQYTATIPFVIDRQNTTYNGASLDLAQNGGSQPKGFDFSPDGTLLFVIFSGSGSDRIICYQLANPYDVITTFAELGGAGNNREDINVIDTYPAGILVRETPSGISIFWHGNENDDIYRQDLLGF